MLKLTILALVLLSLLGNPQPSDDQAQSDQLDFLPAPIALAIDSFDR